MYGIMTGGPKLCLVLIITLHTHAMAKTDKGKCYDQLGCFPTDGPWTTLLRPLPGPMAPEDIDTMLQCFTRSDQSKKYQIELWPDISLNGCPFDGSKKTVILAHGYMNTGNLSWLQEFKDRYLDQVDANFFIVDWGKGALQLNYLQAASNIRIVGAEVARFIKFLQDKHGLSSADLHLMGHSLGAHICSYIAKRIPHAGRLTALDPAQPGFEGTDSQVRLDISDAKFIEVVHTNGAPFIPTLGYGMMTPQGHVDFYINGGMHQPGCQKPATGTEIKDVKDLAKFSIDAIAQLVCCSHCRAYEMYMRVLQDDCMIWGRKATFAEGLINAASAGLIEKEFAKKNKCDPDNCIPLSLDTPKYKARGVFAATTTIEPPFCETNPELNKKVLNEIRDKSNEGNDAAESLLKKLKKKIVDFKKKKEEL